MDGCSDAAEDASATAAPQLWTAEAVQQSKPTYGTAAAAVAGGGGCPSGNVTLSVNVSVPGSTVLRYEQQYLSCRADGQPGHACQPGDDVDIWFNAGPTATNQHWEIRPCSSSSSGGDHSGGESGSRDNGGGQLVATSSSLIVSAMSGACISSSGLMVACDCKDSKQLWIANATTTTTATTTATTTTATVAATARTTAGGGEAVTSCTYQLAQVTQ